MKFVKIIPTYCVTPAHNLPPATHRFFCGFHTKKFLNLHRLKMFLRRRPSGICRGNRRGRPSCFPADIYTPSCGERNQNVMAAVATGDGPFGALIRLTAPNCWWLSASRFCCWPLVRRSGNSWEWTDNRSHNPDYNLRLEKMAEINFDQFQLISVILIPSKHVRNVQFSAGKNAGLWFLMFGS